MSVWWLKDAKKTFRPIPVEGEENARLLAVRLTRPQDEPDRYTIEEIEE